MGREMGRRFKRKGTHIYLQLIHVNVWQKPTKFCKAIILQLKNKLKKKKKGRLDILKVTLVHRQNFIPQDTLGSVLKAFQLLGTGVP